ncbi:MAG: DNA-binding response regulator [Bacteroidota bacterium]|nr:DNA-binding response regulator [Bacteroidota bacterium]
MNKIEILIVEDEPLIAEDISYYLQQAGYENNYIAYNNSEALKFLEEKNIDFIFLDYNLSSDKTGLDLAKEINLNYVLPFAFITSHADKSSIQQIKVVHPVGYIVKPFNGKDIPAVLELGMELFYSYMDSKKGFDINKTNKYVSTEFTSQEKNVVFKLIEGKSNKQISDELFVSLNTTKTHLKNIFLKLEVNSRTEAMVILSKCHS